MHARPSPGPRRRRVVAKLLLLTLGAALVAGVVALGAVGGIPLGDEYGADPVTATIYVGRFTLTPDHPQVEGTVTVHLAEETLEALRAQSSAGVGGALVVDVRRGASPVVAELRLPSGELAPAGHTYRGQPGTVTLLQPFTSCPAQCAPELRFAVSLTGPSRSQSAEVDLEFTALLTRSRADGKPPGKPEPVVDAVRMVTDPDGWDSPVVTSVVDERNVAADAVTLMTSVDDPSLLAVAVRSSRGKVLAPSGIRLNGRPESADAYPDTPVIASQADCEADAGCVIEFMVIHESTVPDTIDWWVTVRPSGVADPTLLHKSTVDATVAPHDVAVATGAVDDDRSATVAVAGIGTAGAEVYAGFTDWREGVDTTRRPGPVAAPGGALPAGFALETWTPLDCAPDCRFSFEAEMSELAAPRLWRIWMIARDPTTGRGAPAPSIQAAQR